MRFNPPLLAAGLLISLTTLNAEASLIPYKNLVYSSVSNITWTADANLFLTQANGYAGGAAAYVNAVIASVPGGKISDTPNPYDTPSYSGFYNLSVSDFNTTTGEVNWFGAQAFTTYLNSINYAGSNLWTLPTAGANPQLAYNQTGAQFGQLFYSELGGKISNNIPNTANFTNEQTSGHWWLATEDGDEGYFHNAWVFTSYGLLTMTSKDQKRSSYAWAVSPGHVSPVPVPGAVWLFGTGLLGLVSLKRRRHAG